MPQPSKSRGDMHHGAIRLLIRDHGPGLSDEAQERLFEPFFTTKDAGHGGFELAISAGIVSDFGGSLAGTNHPEGGVIHPATSSCAEQQTP